MLHTKVNVGIPMSSLFYKKEQDTQFFTLSSWSKFLRYLCVGVYTLPSSTVPKLLQDDSS